MRLICPNCSAQYEIDASLVPDEGRDVQCSNCGHTWFELPPAPAEADPVALKEKPPVVAEPAGGVAEAGANENEVAAEPEDADDETGAAEEVRETSRAARAIAAATRDLDDIGEGHEEDLDEEEVFGAAVRPRRPPVDKAAMDVLKEEAEREMAQRRAAPSVPLETQGDLGIDVLAERTPSRALKARMARVTGEEKESAPPPDRNKPVQEEYQAPRKDLLPDIDEINSSLRPASERDGGEAAEFERRRGFRLGFGLVLVTAALLIFAYAYAPSIAAALPSTETTLIQYVDWANGVRDWLDRLLG